MKARLCLLAGALALTLGLLMNSYRERRKLQESLDFQTSSVRAMGAEHATTDLSRSNASYYLIGQMERKYVEAFEARFREYRIKPEAVGCAITQAQGQYSDEYNRVIREFLVKRHGKDLIQEFDTSYWTNLAR